MQVLIIDNDIAYRNGVSMAASNKHWIPVSCGDIRTAKQIISSTLPDLIISDCLLYGETVIDLLVCGLSRNHFYTFHNICFCNFAYARHEEKHLQFYSYETDQQPELCSGQIYCWNLNGLTLCCYTNSDCRCCRCKCRKQLWIQNKPLGYLGQYHNV